MAELVSQKEFVIPRRFCVHDTQNNLHFLVDTGAQSSVLPYIYRDGSTQDSAIQKIYSAAGSDTIVSGQRTLKLNIAGLNKREFVWTFLVADTDQEIGVLGADFLYHYGLSVDLRTAKLVDLTSSRSIEATCNYYSNALLATRIFPPHLIVHEEQHKLNFVVDTGAEYSILPSTFRYEDRVPHGAQAYLTAFGGSKIFIRGLETLKLKLNIGLRRDKFVWTFLVTDAERAILGADFLYHYGLNVDIRGARLVESTCESTSLRSRGATCNDLEDSRYHEFELPKYPKIEQEYDTPHNGNAEQEANNRMFPQAVPRQQDNIE